jgi:hypothetical protein
MGGEYQDTGKQLPASVLLKGDPNYAEKTATALGLTTLKTVPSTSATLRMTYKDSKTIPTAIADRIGKDYYGRFAKLYDWTYAGIQPWQLSVYDDCAIYFHNKYHSQPAVGAEAGNFRCQTRIRGWVANLRPESPETGSGTAEEEQPPVDPTAFSCGNCTSCLNEDDAGVNSDCALADPSPNSWFLQDTEISNCCDNLQDFNVELIHQSGCLWKSNELPCKEKFIEESWLDPTKPERDENIFHNWTLEIQGDWVVLTHRFYRKT